MAFAICLQPFPPPTLGTFSTSSPVSRRRRFFLSTKFSTRTSASAVAKEAGPGIVWFKHDLRIDDHAGLVQAAARHRTVVPIYVFDPRILSRFSDEMLDLLLLAVGDLRRSLKDQGTDVLIGLGNAEHIIVKLAHELKATHIYAEEEVEYEIRKVLGNVEASLSALSFSWGSPHFIYWHTTLYDMKNWKNLPLSYPDFQKLKLPLVAPLSVPSLPVLYLDLDKGQLPTFSDLKLLLMESPRNLDQNWLSLKKFSAKAILERGQLQEIQSEVFEDHQNHKEKNNEAAPSSLRNKRLKSFFASKAKNQVGGGTDAVLSALSAYLRYLEATSRDDWQELHEKVRQNEKREGASFGALFGASLHLGIISLRRVYHEAIKYERERNGGFLSPFGYSAFTVTAAVHTILSMEWYWILALRSQTCNGMMFPIRIWRWKGHLIQYAVSGCEGPPVLLVHGFGAFLEHFRGNISGMAESGHRVWAVTLLGFGRSEKPNIFYTELMWAELVRDFIIDIVREPVHLVGNSIGGYFVASVAGLWPMLVKSVVLLNTAGSVIPGYSLVKSTETGQTSRLAWLGTRLLLLYLRSQVVSILKKCYPVNNDRADSWLINEILRASYDPGVLVVLESIFNFKQRVPINYLLDSFGGKVLIIQGTKDPLSNSKMRLSMFREHCSWVTIRELDAGHCPHDELPEDVNSVLIEWIRTTERSYCIAGRV